MSRPLAWLLALLFALASLTWALTAQAHGRSVSYSSWLLTAEGGRVRAEVSMLDANAISASGFDGELGAQLPRLLRLEVDSTACEAGPVHALGGKPGWRRFSWSVRCPAGTRTVASDLLFDLTPGHLHFAELRFATGEAPLERVLSEASRSALASPEPTPSFIAVVRQYLPIGLEHIAFGADHLVFLFALALVARRLRSLALIATGFTLGHTVTLAAAVLGEVRAELPTIEAMIGLSIALLAAENAWLFEARSAALRDRRIPIVTVAAIALFAPLAAWRGTVSALALVGATLFAGCYFAWLARLPEVNGARERERARATVAALFGLVHGFGFAGVLTDAQLPASRLGAALLGFNIGVELGQLLFVTLVFGLALAVRRRAGDDGHVVLVRWGSAAAIAAGSFWFVTRTLG